MDPALRKLLRSEESVEDRTVEAIIRLRQPSLAVDGVRIVSRFGQIATCRLARSAIKKVRAHSNVVSLKASRSLGPEMEPFLAEDSGQPAPDTAATDVRRRPDLPLTGRGVVVGVIDWGLDFDHPSFKSPDGSTRLLALWDQRKNTAVGGSPEPFRYGTLHLQKQIDEALRSPQPYRYLRYHPAAADRGGGSHGTHVMDIAAGNGSGGGPSGVAPEADLVFVHLADHDMGGLANLGDSVRLLEAVDFIARMAGDRPWVINSSVGQHAGPHNGTTLIELAYDDLLSSGPGRFIVQSAGNYYRSRTHACGLLKQGETKKLTFLTDKADTSMNELEIWYDGDDELAVRVDPPGSTRTQPVRLESEDEIVVDGQTVGWVYHRGHDPNNYDNHIDAFLFPRGRAGAWTVTLEAKHVINGRFHAWLERDQACTLCQTRFIVEDSNSTSTTGTIANGRVPLVVGAYNAHSHSRPVAAFSSSGPTRDGRCKPDLCAPGVGVLAARSAPRGSTSSHGQYVRKSGTSMAAPHVAGAVALCLQAGGHRLQARQIRSLVLSTVDAQSRGADRRRRGRGYLDLPKLVATVLRAFPARSAIDNKEQSMDSAIDALAFAPSQAYRELMYRPEGQTSRWLGQRLGVLARPGQRMATAPKVGDVMLQVALGLTGIGVCSVLTDAGLSRQRANGADGSAGWYAAVTDAAGAVPLTRRILDPAGRVLPGLLLLRPRVSLDDGTVDPHQVANHKADKQDADPRRYSPHTPTNAAIEGRLVNYGRQMDQWNNSDGRLAKSDHYNPGIGGNRTSSESPELYAPFSVSDSRRWADLICHRPSEAVLQTLSKRDMSLLTLRDAIGRLVNLDRFEVRISRMPVINGRRADAPALTRAFRSGLTGKSPIFIDPEASTFEPYAEADNLIWTSDNPVGAVLHIDIPMLDGAVVVSKADKQSWVFSTVRTERSGVHPISGNRQFGVRKEANEHILYTRGVDRASLLITDMWSSATFAGGKSLWLSLQQRVAAWINTNGGKASVPEPEDGQFSWAAVRALVRCPQQQ